MNGGIPGHVFNHAASAAWCFHGIFTDVLGYYLLAGKKGQPATEQQKENGGGAEDRPGSSDETTVDSTSIRTNDWQVVLTLSASLLIATPCPASCLFLGADTDTVPAFPDNSARAIIEASSLPFTSAHKCTDSTATPGPKDYLSLRKSFPAFSGHGSSHCESMANMLIFFAPQVDLEQKTRSGSSPQKRANTL
ncbi:uncharacterized protein LOC142784974 [Rhipicephalus microplus]|uniref:uncharacterized protein LOC142784974 n=1 Tax=Rhipicephalus microplus TaxID=6941 RepID=UPI003F6B6FD8